MIEIDSTVIVAMALMAGAIIILLIDPLVRGIQSIRQKARDRAVAKEPIDWSPHHNLLPADHPLQALKNEMTFKEVADDLLTTEELLYVANNEVRRLNAELEQARAEIDRLNRVKTRHWRSYQRVKCTFEQFKIEVGETLWGEVGQCST